MQVKAGKEKTVKLIDMTGQKFGRLLVMKRSGLLPNGSTSLKAWLCKCDCGDMVVVRGSCLRSGNTKSCGCYARETNSRIHRTHGQSGTPIYKLWIDIRKRCSPKASKRHRIFYNGIKVCEEWKKFENFYNWAKDKFIRGLDIDRKNTLGDYSPDNCRFISRKLNAQNKKNSKLWIVKGLIFKSAYDAAKHFGCSYSHIYSMCHGRKTKTKYYEPHPGCSAQKKYRKVLS